MTILLGKCCCSTDQQRGQTLGRSARCAGGRHNDESKPLGCCFKAPCHEDASWQSRLQGWTAGTLTMTTSGRVSVDGSFAYRASSRRQVCLSSELDHEDAPFARLPGAGSMLERFFGISTMRWPQIMSQNRARVTAPNVALQDQPVASTSILAMNTAITLVKYTYRNELHVSFVSGNCVCTQWDARIYFSWGARCKAR